MEKQQRRLKATSKAVLRINELKAQHGINWGMSAAAKKVHEQRAAAKR